MSNTNNTLKKNKNQYHHLTEKDRASIQALIEQKDKNGKRLFNNKYIANWMNNYPRKSLNYKTPLEAILEEFNNKFIINKIYKLQEVVNII